MNTINGKLALTIPETAEAMSVSRSTVYKLISKDPTFPRKKILGALRVPVAELIVWMSKGEFE